MTAPPFAYFGGKTTAAARIVGHLPPHLHYVEPFGGSLAVLLAKPRSRMETVNDLDGAVMTFWRMLRDRPADLVRSCQLTPHSRAEWEACADLEVPDDLEVARRVWVRLTQGRAGQLTRTGWRHYVAPGGQSTAFPGYLDGYVDRMAAAAERLHHVSLECRPALELIEKYGADEDVLLYVDPPYLGSARGFGNKGYRYEMRGEADHRELAAALHGCAAAVVLSGYASELYAELYSDWRRVEFPSGTGQGGDGWSNRTEVLWSNRERVPDLFSGSVFPDGGTQ